MSSKITRCHAGTSLIITVDGNIDTASDLAACLPATDEEAASPHVILDLSVATHLDPDAVPPLVAAYWRITNRGARFSVVAPHQRVRMALMLSALDWLIPLYESTHAAELDLTL